MKATKMTIISLLTALMLAAFCGCRMEDGNVRQSPHASPMTTHHASSPAPRHNDARRRENLGDDIGRGTHDIGNGVRDIGDDVGRGMNDIGRDIERASGAAKQI